MNTEEIITFDDNFVWIDEDHYIDPDYVQAWQESRYSGPIIELD